MHVKNKTPLFIIELIIMSLLLSFTVVVCLQGLVNAHKKSKQVQALDIAVTMAESTADLLEYYKGNIEKVSEIIGADRYTQEGFTIDFDEHMHRTKENRSYTLGVSVDRKTVSGLGTADITIWDVSKDCELFSISTGWQMEVE